MASPFRRAPRRTAHLAPVPNEFERNPQDVEGFLISDRTYKADAAIDFTIRAVSHVASRRSIVVVPGFGGIKPVYGDFRDEIAKATGSNTTSYRQPRSQKPKSVMRFVDSTLHPEKLGKQSVVAMIDVMRDIYPDQKVTLIGHSMGTPNSVDAALRRMDDVEDIIMVGGGGLEKGQNVGRLTKRMPAIARGEGNSVREMPREDAINIGLQALYHVVRDPWRTLGEGIDVGSRDLMVDELATLRAYGIGLHAVQLENDGFFPTDIARQDAEPHVDSFSVVPDVDHLAPQIYPRIVAEHIAEILSDKRPALFSEVS